MSDDLDVGASCPAALAGSLDDETTYQRCQLLSGHAGEHEWEDV